MVAAQRKDPVVDVNGNGESGDGDAGEIGVGENEDVGEGACALASAYEVEQYGEAVEAVLHAREGLKSGAHVGAVGGWGHPSQAVAAEYPRRRLPYDSYLLAR